MGSIQANAWWACILRLQLPVKPPGGELDNANAYGWLSTEVNFAICMSVGELSEELSDINPVIWKTYSESNVKLSYLVETGTCCIGNSVRLREET